MRNLCDEWARLVAEDLLADRPAWLGEEVRVRTMATTDPKIRPLVLLMGEEEARVHERLAVGRVNFELHWRRDDGTPEEGRELARLLGEEIDRRRAGIRVPEAVMRYYMPGPLEEEDAEEGWIFRVVRECRFMERREIG